MIDIGSTPDSPIRLHITDSMGRVITPYVALSSSWGTELPLRTTKETLDKYCEEIPFEDFPKTLHDALRVTRGMGLQYIWIDALCIIQDDENDWQEQAALMGEIYQGSMINISTTSSTSLSSGFLSRSETGPNPRVRVGRYFHKDGINHGGVYVSVFDLGTAFSPPSDLNESFLSSRGWVFQEQLMSTATLHYMAQEMVWECATVIRNERFADASTVIKSPRLDGWIRLAPLKWGWINFLRSKKPEHLDRNRDGMLVPSAENDDNFNILMALWKEWIFDYSKRDLTYGNDRLPAIAGITELISKKYGLHFTAGHFTQDMPLGLWWSPRKSPKNSRETNLGENKINEATNLPFWSWPSFPGGVWYGGSNKVHNLQITCSESPSDLKILCYTFEIDSPSNVYARTCLSIEVEGLLQEVQVEYRAGRYHIATGITLANWSVQFDNPPPMEQSPWRKYLLRVTGYNSKLYDLLVPFASARAGRDKGHEVVSRLRQNPDNVWCLVLEEVLPSSDTLRTFRRIGLADTGNEWPESTVTSADVFLDPKRLKMRLV